MNHVVFDETGRIRKRGNCSARDMPLQASKANRYAMEGEGSGRTQKVEFDGFDQAGQPIDPRIVDKTPQELETDNPTYPPIPDDEKQKYLKNKDWDALVARVQALEGN